MASNNSILQEKTLNCGERC